MYQLTMLPQKNASPSCQIFDHQNTQCSMTANLAQVIFECPNLLLFTNTVKLNTLLSNRKHLYRIVDFRNLVWDQQIHLLWFFGVYFTNMASAILFDTNIPFNISVQPKQLDKGQFRISLNCPTHANNKEQRVEEQKDGTKAKSFTTRFSIENDCYNWKCFSYAVNTCIVS